jgi:hypothetical protein
MDPRNAAQRVQPDGPDGGELEAIEFVRFCYRRRRVGWPELYDEMCAVAGRGLYRGYGADELNGLGIGFSLFEMQALASLVRRVVAEDQERRRLALQAVRIVSEPAIAPEPTVAPEPPVAVEIEMPSVIPVRAPEHAAPEPAERHAPLVAAAAPAGA